MGVEKLDNIDKRLLYELDLDSRQPISRLAKKLHMSPQRLDYRLKAIEAKGVVRHYVTVIDYRKLGGYNYYVCNLRIFGLGQEEEDRIVRGFAEDEKCSLVFKCEGRWNLMIGTVAVDIFEAQETFERLLAPLKGKLEEKQVVMHIGSYQYGNRYLLEEAYVDSSPVQQHKKKSEEEYALTGKKTKTMPYDELDIQILKVLSINARMPTINIAKEVNSNPETVSYRIKEMEKKGIIKRYSLQLWPEKYGRMFYRIYVKMEHMVEDEEELVLFLRRFPEMYRVVRLFGSYDFLVDIITESDEKRRFVLSNIKEHYRNGPISFEPNNVYEIVKFAYFPTKKVSNSSWK